MVAVRRYWFWCLMGSLTLALLIVRILLVGGVNGEVADGYDAVKKEGGKIKKHKKSALLNPKKQQVYQAEIDRLTKMREGVRGDFIENNKKFDSFMGADGAIQAELPDEVTYKEAWGNAVRELIAKLKKRGDLETELDIDEKGALKPGAFQFKANLFGNGIVRRRDIPLSQKQLWIQLSLVDAVLSVEASADDVLSKEIAELLAASPSKAPKAADGTAPQVTYDEAVYQRLYHIEKINKITVDQGRRYDDQKEFRLFKVLLDCDMQFSLIPRLNAGLLMYPNAIVKIRDIQVKAKGMQKSGDNTKTDSTRYAEAPVNVVYTLYYLDYLNKAERETIKDLKVAE